MPPESKTSEQDQAAKQEKGLLRRLLGPWTFLILVLALGGYFYYQQTQKQEAVQEEQKQPPQSVSTARVLGHTLEVTVQGVGSLQAVQTVQIKPEISGKLQKVHFQEGSFVPEDELLFEIERDKLSRRLMARQAALEEARARLKNARLNHQRLSMLRQQDMVSEEDYDQAQYELEAVSAELERLESEVELARLDLQDSSIHAPLAGFISESAVDPGTFVAEGEPLARLYATDPLEIAFYIPEKYSGQVESGQEVRVQVAAFPDKTFQGEVNFVSPVIQESTRMLKVRALLDNPRHLLKPGTFASAQLVLEKKKDRAVVPESALVSIRGGYMLYVVDQEEDVVHSRQVETGLRKPGLVEIVKGPKPGETVVESGHMQLNDGSRIQIKEELGSDWLEGQPDSAQQAAGGQSK
ncbi:MAG: efflux RND transporter periplasmic adaptor subunit [Thermodesulfobacteriota bacterium]